MFMLQSRCWNIVAFPGTLLFACSCDNRHGAFTLQLFTSPSCWHGRELWSQTFKLWVESLTWRNDTFYGIWWQWAWLVFNKNVVLWQGRRKDGMECILWIKNALDTVSFSLSGSNCLFQIISHDSNTCYFFYLQWAGMRKEWIEWMNNVADCGWERMKLNSVSFGTPCVLLG